MLLKAEGVGKAFGPKQVLKEVDLQIEMGDRIGLVGRNGAGKTTLIKLFMGHIKPDVGMLTLKTSKVSYLSQFVEVDHSASVDSTVGVLSEEAAPLKRRAMEIEEVMASGGDSDTDWNALSQEYASVQDELLRISPSQTKGKALGILGEFGLEHKAQGSMGELSGGERTKVMLSRVLAQAEQSDLIFLDEPTSHLDIETVEWLEDQLLKLKGAVIIISHDRYFLDNVATRIIELEDGKLTHYSGNYTVFMEKKALDRERLMQAHDKALREKERQERIAEELHVKYKFKSIHKTREKMAERIEVPDPPIEEKDLQVRIYALGKSGKNVITGKDLVVARGNRKVLDKLDIEIEKGDKLGIFGPNGSGKTTLLKALQSKLPYLGELHVSPGVKIGYYAQEHDLLEQDLTAEQQMKKTLGQQATESRAILARLLLIGKDVERPISILSGGERARVALAMLLAQHKNLLILDEPSNYLDIPSKEAVEAALREYTGTMIIVTHDRYLLDAVCTKVGELRGGKLTVFNGTYSEMKGRQKSSQGVEVADVYKAVSSFKDWTNGATYKAGDKVIIAKTELENFKWALETGKLKKVGGTELKKVRKPPAPAEDD
ncbi:MAG: ABC-F family ATP-binding cassette domain-containing protein [Methanomassiliicoccales archaeon]|nr:ABC-F family ATP-binding cassette domain-containing protein [Methanomassiliicoccales archaeon]